MCPPIQSDLVVLIATQNYLSDFSRVLFMMREQMSIQLLREAFATTGQIGFLCHVRADVAVTYPQALTVVKGVRP